MAAAPALVVYCTIIELAPAVFDDQGVCIRPPVLAPPAQYTVDLGSDQAVLLDPSTGLPAQTDANGNPVSVSLADAGLEPTETLDEWTARQQQAATDAKVVARTAEARAWVELRMIRDRWLAQTDYIEVFLGGGFSPLPQAVQDAISANNSGWLSWRQALRDLPSQVGTAGTPSFDPVEVVAGAAGIHSTADSFPAPWPQPPAAPVIHLT